MTKLCRTNIDKLIRNTYKVFKKANKDKVDTSMTFRLNDSYKAEIAMECVTPTENEDPSKIDGGDLTYYIINSKGVAIDQVTLGWVCFDDNIDEKANKELSYLLNMYC